MCTRLHKYNVALLLLILSLLGGCGKEYSYEGGAGPTIPIIPVDTTSANDSVSVDYEELFSCNSCIASDTLAQWEWSFKTGNSLLCGKSDTAILNPERNSFTFFGPSTCAADSGLIFTVYLEPNVLDRDITNLDASHAIFYYYDTNGPYVLTSHYDRPFSLTIKSYVHATGIATGNFSGVGYRQDSSVINITDGKFKIKLL